jgi:predicted polyphosphate/ATP-dependent NAD kinase
LGFIVNPVAGIGGRVGLKGSDGAEIQQQALALGAVPRALDRAEQALERLKALEGQLEIVTYPGEMGEDAARACGFEPTVVGEITPGSTTAEDTVQAAREMQRQGVDLLLFAGGDGTARDVYRAIGSSGLPALGIPAGVKIHSAVYATSPRGAGALALSYLQGRVSSLREAEVMDLDEDAFREGVVSARLYGYLNVPFRASLVQNLKMANPGGASASSIAVDVVDKMEAGCLYIIGPGTTTRAITDELALEKALLGVDVVLDRRLLASDVNEAQLLALLDEHEGHKAKIIVTLIGGQGYVFGRGNQQISPKVIEQVVTDPQRPFDDILVVSTKEKLYSLGSQPLLVDTGDRAVDEMLCGYVQVVTGYNERAVRKVVADGGAVND